MVQISLQNVSRSFGSEVIFSDVTAKIEDHDRIGLVGQDYPSAGHLRGIGTG